jgi:8-amino-7-oxononanoate synthase
MGFETQIRGALLELEREGLRRHPKRVSGAQGPEIEIDGRRTLCFCSNNYLGLADHPRIAEALRGTPAEEGVGAAASRLITGTMDAHEELESALASFQRLPDALLFSSGYAANVGTIQALVGRGDVVFSDALNHASLIDGARLSRAAIHVFQHGDADHLESLLRAHRGSAVRALILTDSLFSMDGDRAPLEELATLARDHDAGLLVDEAHALGVFGPQGRGLCAELGVVPDVLIGTLGKSFGVSGAYAAGSVELVSFLRNRARSFVYSTAPPPAVARAALASIPLVQGAQERRAALFAHARQLRQGLRALDYRIDSEDSQIIPVHIGENDRTMELSAELLDRGVFVQGIRPPTVPVGSARLRLTAMATHRPDQIERALEAFASLAPRG